MHTTEHMHFYNIPSSIISADSRINLTTSKFEILIRLNHKGITYIKSYSSPTTQNLGLTTPNVTGFLYGYVSVELTNTISLHTKNYEYLIYDLDSKTTVGPIAFGVGSSTMTEIPIGLTITAIQLDQINSKISIMCNDNNSTA